MKLLTIIIYAAVLCMSCNNAIAQGVSPTNTKPQERPDSATAMKNWMNYMTPGKEHELLAAANGSWVGEVTMWMEPDKPPMKSTTTTTNNMLLGNRYQQSVHKGDMMGMPFEGISTVAFDNHKKVFITSWIDNMGTGVMTAEGPWDEATKSITFKGKMVDPTLGNGKECDFREVFTIIDNDNQKMEMYAPDPKTGKEFKNMEIKMTRKK
ncbi:MAG: DUF1579 domain-containing protein [Flavisolibacter sp.]